MIIYLNDYEDPTSVGPSLLEIVFILLHIYFGYLWKVRIFAVEKLII